jgi:uncharacterized protein
MKIINKLNLAALIIVEIILSTNCYCQGVKKTNTNSVSFPSAIHYTSDYENIIDKADEDKLNRLLSDIEAETKLEFAIVTISSKMMGNMDIQKYTLELANQWGVGVKGLNNGVLIGISIEAKKIYIQIGTGIEAIYTNNQVKSVIDQTITPAFKRQRFYEGLFSGIIRITEELKPNLSKIYPK